VLVVATDVSEELRACIVRVLKVQFSRRSDAFYISQLPRNARNSLPVDTKSHRSTLVSSPVSVPSMFSSFRTARNDSMLEAKPKQLSQRKEANSFQ
jgi:hypothetical protein